MPVNSLSQTEHYIMQLFWQHGPMKSDELAALVAGKGWKTTTLLTFLSRLAGKNMLRVEKHGRNNIYTPCVSEAEYKTEESRTFLNERYDGSAKNFVAALVDGSGITKQELAELRAWLEQQQEDA